MRWFWLRRDDRSCSAGTKKSASASATRRSGVPGLPEELDATQ